MNFAVKNNPNLTLTYNKYLLRIWIKQDEVIIEDDHFKRQQYATE
jgi:hypothetical protein